MIDDVAGSISFACCPSASMHCDVFRPTKPIAERRQNSVPSRK
jgi:hypothetical protein